MNSGTSPTCSYEFELLKLLSQYLPSEVTSASSCNLANLGENTTAELLLFLCAQPRKANERGAKELTLACGRDGIGVYSIAAAGPCLVSKGMRMPYFFFFAK